MPNHDRSSPPFWYLTLIWLSFVLCGCSAERKSAPPPAATVKKMLRERTAWATGGAPLRVGEERILAVKAIPAFYQEREHRPGWVADGCPSPLVRELVGVIEAVDREGLKPSDYHLDAIRERAAAAREGGCADGKWPQDEAANLDLLLSDAFLLLGSHLLGGRINPETLDPEWHAQRKAVDLPALLKASLASRKIAAALDGLRPPQEGYGRLSSALASQLELLNKGGWSAVDGEAELKHGDSGDRVKLLRARLAVEGFIEASDRGQYDEALEKAVIAFQSRYGVKATGVMDTATLKQLNVSAQDRAMQMAMNLERWRWLPADLGQRHVMVSVPTYWVSLMEDGKEVMGMKAVVGKHYRRTPLLSSAIKAVVLNPYWSVPHKIAVTARPTLHAPPAGSTCQRRADSTRIETGSWSGR